MSLNKTQSHSSKNGSFTDSGLVSVIVPTYNRPETLKKAIESIAAQTYKHIEAIVVNDAGEDVSNIIETFQNRLAIKYIVHDVNKDRAAARNTAIKHATGQYIAYLDDDDIFYPEHIETALKILTNTEHKIVYTNAYRAHQIKCGDTYLVIGKDIPYSIDYVKGIFYTTNITPILCVVHDRSCFDKVGMFDESLPVLEDWDLWIRMSEKYDFYHIKQATCEFSWRVDGTSTTSSRQDEFARVRELIYKKNYKRFLETGIQISTCSRKPVSIIILTWNALEYTKKCIDSIRHHTNYPHEIIFVDNASTDGTVEYLQKLIEENQIYKLIKNQTNKGFAAGNNEGVAVASGEYVMLLNNDVLVSAGWLESLVLSLERDEKIGMVGPITNSISGRQMVRNIPYADENGFHIFAQKIRKTYNGRLTPRYRIAGFAVLMRKTLYEEVGGLDESFGTGNYEDDDLCLKVREKGYAIMVDESVLIHHYRSQTFIENKIDYRNSLTVNESRFREKWPNVDYEQLLELHNNLVDTNKALVAQAQQALESGNICEAIELYSKVLKTNPIDEAALYGIGLAYQMSGKMDYAIDAYKKVIKTRPYFYRQEPSRDGSYLLDAYYNLALVYANTSQIDNAISTLKEATELHNGEASAYNNLGVLYFKKHMHNYARICFEKALSIDANYREAQQNLKKIYKVLGKNYL
ncbi:MAG: glycosyltransferase [Candidatus Brocadia sp.]|jgi:GT2 family glycosyltransferase